MFIFFIIKYFKTIITISKVTVLILLVDIVIFVLLLKRRDRLLKIAKNAFISKKRDRLFKIKIVTNNKKNNNI